MCIGWTHNTCLSAIASFTLAAKLRRHAGTVGLVVVVLVALALRYKNLWYREFWYDEAVTGVMVQSPWRNMVTDLVADIHPLFYYLLLKGWGQVWGYGEAALRSFSLAWGGVLVPLVYCLAKRGSQSTRVALAACSVVAVSPFFVAYSLEARMYMLSAALGTAEAIFFYRALFTHRLGFNADWALFSILAGLGAHTHYQSLFTLPVYGGITAYYLNKERPVTKENFTRRLGEFSLFFCKTFGVGAAMFLPWIPIFWQQIRHSGRLWWIPRVTLSSIPGSLYAFLFGVENSALGSPPLNRLVIGIDPILMGVIIFALVIGTTVGTWKRFAEQERPFLVMLLLLWAVPIVAIFLFSALGAFNLYINRYLIQAAVFFIIYLVLILSKIPCKPVALGLAVLYCGLLPLVMSDSHNRGLRGLADYLSAQGAIQGGRLAQDLIFTDFNEFAVARYYLGLSNDRYLHFYDFDHPDSPVYSWPAIGAQFKPTPLDELPNGTLLIIKTRQAIENWELVGKLDKLYVYRLLSDARPSQQPSWALP